MRALFVALLGLFCCAWSTADAQEIGLFRILKLEGHQVQWRVPRDGSPRIVTYRLASEPQTFPGARNCGKITSLDELVARSGLTSAAVKGELATAFAMWETAANITFREAPEGTRADILVGAQAEPVGWAFAEVFYDLTSPEPIKPISRALVCLNPLRGWKIGFDGDLRQYDLRYTFAHEIGHAIGLDHPAGGDQVMGYRYEERFRTLQPGDVRGAIALYGAARHAGVTDAGVDEARTASTPAAPHRYVKRWGTRAFTDPAP